MNFQVFQTSIAKKPYIFVIFFFFFGGGGGEGGTDPLPPTGSVYVKKNLRIINMLSTNACFYVICCCFLK